MDSRLTKVLFFPLDWATLQTEIADDDNRYKLLVLDNRQLSVTLSAVNILTKCFWAWGIKKDDPTWDAIEAFRDGIEEALMAVLSIDDLIKTNLMIVAALTGETIDRDHPENYLTGEYAPDGLTPTIVAGNETLSTLNTSVTTGFENEVEALGTIDTTVSTGFADTVEALGTLDTTVSTGFATQDATLDLMLAQIELIQTSLATIAQADPEALADDLEGIATTISTIATILGVVV